MYTIDPFHQHHFRIAVVAIHHVGVPHVRTAYKSGIYTPFVMSKKAAKKGFNPGYASTIVDAQSKQRYAYKLRLISSYDPYELPGEEWQDNIEMWPAITFVHMCMYLILNPSPYSTDDMLNYKSLDSFKNFQNGWVRELLVKEVNERRIMIGKVSYYTIIIHMHCLKIIIK